VAGVLIHVIYIYLPEPRVHGCVLANGDWWVELSARPVSPSFLIGFFAIQPF
jgi:hypothetical protein